MRENFEPKTFFLKNVTITDPKSDAKVIFKCLMKALVDDGIDISKCLGFGSDGGAVMVGKDNGVAAHVKRESPHCISVHCMAHRLNLATSQASNNIEYLKSVEKTLSDLYYYFGGSKSGNRKCELEEIQTILDDPKLKIKECHQIRWLAFMEAVRAVFMCWLSLREFFRGKTDSKARSFYETFKQYKFLAILCLLMDILPTLSQLSMQLQKRDLDIASVHPALRTVESEVKKAKTGSSYYQQKLLEGLVKKRDKDGVLIEVKYKGKMLEFDGDMRKVTEEIQDVRKKFCDALLENMDKRFPEHSKEMALAFGKLSMRPLSILNENDRSTFGDTEINKLTDFFGHSAQNQVSKKKSKRLIDPEKCRAEWQVAKQLVFDNQYLRDSSKVLYKQLFEFHK